MQGNSNSLKTIKFAPVVKKEVFMQERCEFFEQCGLFHNSMFLNTGLAASIRISFCQGCKQNCARYQVTKKIGSEYLTSSLLPFMKEKAEQIICEYTY